ncbi:hypothetical protein V1512DRAFT_288020 [Lipomyces arxii]|uniref:uncharacterized protein n=1 Tax=Lipomyces arxii TaxID=56418 RepID=UPI0034CE2C56
MAPKKGKKMALTDFLQDDQYGSSWADDDELPTTVAATEKLSSERSTGFGDRPAYGDRNDRYGGTEERDYGRMREREREREPRTEREQLPVPDHPPYTAHVGNVANEISDDSVIAGYFEGLKIANVRLVKDKMDQPKGFAYVEFQDRESLVNALDRSGGDLQGRPVRISVAEPPKEDRTQGEWRSGKPLPPIERDSADRPGRGERRVVSDGKVRDFDSWERRGPLSPPPPRMRRTSGFSPNRSGERGPREPREEPENSRSFDNWRSGSAFEASRKSATPNRSREGSSTPGEDAPAPRPAERRRLNLKPRTQPTEATEAEAAPAIATTAPAKASPFGSAAPVDTARKMRELDDKIAADAAKRAEERLQAREAAREAAAREQHREARPERDFSDLRKERPAMTGRGGHGHARGGHAHATERRPRTAKEAGPSKAEVVDPKRKQFDLLRKVGASDDFVPDNDEEDEAVVGESGIKIAPAPVEAKIAENAENAAAAIAAIAAEGDAEWLVLPQSKSGANGK